MEDYERRHINRLSRNNYCGKTNDEPPSLRTRACSRVAMVNDSNKKSDQSLLLNATEMFPKANAKTSISPANSMNHQKELQSNQKMLNEQQKENAVSKYLY